MTSNLRKEQTTNQKRKFFQIFINLKQKIHWIMQTIAKSKQKQESQKLTKKQNRQSI